MSSVSLWSCTCSSVKLLAVLIHSAATVRFLQRGRMHSSPCMYSECCLATLPWWTHSLRASTRSPLTTIEQQVVFGSIQKRCLCIIHIWSLYYQAHFSTKYLYFTCCAEWSVSNLTANTFCGRCKDICSCLKCTIKPQTNKTVISHTFVHQPMNCFHHQLEFHSAQWCLLFTLVLNEDWPTCYQTLYTWLLTNPYSSVGNLSSREGIIFMPSDCI